MPVVSSDAVEAQGSASQDSAPPKRRSWAKRIGWGILIVVLLLILLLVWLLMHFQIPQNAAGMAAKSVCSAAFVAGREPDADELMAQDVLPASPALKLVSVDIDTDSHSVTARFAGLFERQASLLENRGCVLNEDPDPAAMPYSPPPSDPAQWPEGDAPVEKMPQGVDAEALTAVLDKQFEGSGDPEAANTRGVAVVQDGKLLAVRDGADIEPNVALHGWSATKTVAAMLAWKRFSEVGIDVSTKVVDAFPDGREPEWVAQWRQDERGDMTLLNLLNMTSGLNLSEGYQPWEQVVQMLYGEPNMAGWAASAPAEYPPGTHWEYLSADSNILAEVVQAQFGSDQEYWQYPRSALFGPIGADSATLETDTYGTWVGSSYLWASIGDWARLGQLMLEDGNWQGDQVFERGWTRLATTPALPEGEGHGYGAQTWLPGQPTDGECAGQADVPADTMSMDGHWGQFIAMVPSRNVVVARLGWTFNSDQFDQCTFLQDVLATLPAK